MFETIINNIAPIFEAIGYIVTAASVIVKLTPTTKDDSVLEKIINVLDYFSVFNPKKVQEKLDK